MSTVFYKSKDGQNHPIKFYDLLDEGMESLAMLGATNLLEKVRPVWQMGIHLQIKHGVDVPTFPGWVDSIDGGFDWSKINQLDYIVCDYNGNQINPNIILLQGGEYIFVPKEKW
jgi:hypothetical protein